MCDMAGEIAGETEGEGTKWFDPMTGPGWRPTGAGGTAKEFGCNGPSPNDMFANWVVGGAIPAKTSCPAFDGAGRNAAPYD